jgi:type VI secretion system protein ImpM
MTASGGIASEIGIFGKHPTLGDFFHRGVAPDLRSSFDHWLTEALFEAKEQLAEEWQATFDAARPIRFWIGSAVIAPLGLAGVMVPSRDRAGRRFPLAALSPGHPAAPPSLASDQAWYRRLEGALVEIAAEPDQTADAMIAALQERLSAADAAAEGDAAAGAGPAAPASGQFWAFNEDLDAAALWEQAAREDLRRAARSRSYLWVEGGAGRSAAVLGCDGLPSGRALAWALSTALT